MLQKIVKIYRVIFGLAAFYNIAFGLWAALFSDQFFTLFYLAPLPYPSIWACLGMVVGLYGFLYAYAAWKPDRADLLIGVGLLGKVLGPMGWLLAVWSGELPPRTFPLILLNDLIWWFPFLFFLLRRNRWRRTIIAGLTVGLHGLACLGLILAGGGTEMEADFPNRWRWVLDHAGLWTVVWFFWVLSSMSLLAFVAIWSRSLFEKHLSRVGILIACALTAVGVLCDVFGEFVNIAWLTEPWRTLDEFRQGAGAYLLLSAAAANGLYCAAGLVLSGLSWRAGLVRGFLGIWGLTMWSVGLGLTIAALADARLATVVFGSAVMALFIPWAGLMGWRWRPRPS